jgi:hypothetical protein
MMGMTSFVGFSDFDILGRPRRFFLTTFS